MAEGVAWMGRGCDGGALEPLRYEVCMKIQRPKILPVDVCMYYMYVTKNNGVRMTKWGMKNAACGQALS